MNRGPKSTRNGRPGKSADIGRLFGDTGKVQRALAKGVRDALIMHKKLGNPIATWKDGKVVWVPPEKIVIRDDDGQR